MIMLDTNICIYLINQRPPGVIEHFNRFRAGEVGLSSVVASELAYGVAKSGSARNRNALALFLAPLAVLPYDEHCVWVYGELRATLELQGQPIGAMDTMIAAHALAVGAPLVTNNVREFSKVPNLPIENWAA